MTLPGLHLTPPPSGLRGCRRLFTKVNVRSLNGDMTSRARIRDAAIVRFGQEGFTAGVRAIAAEAGVSPALVIRHFGSKEGLRASCDEHVATFVRAMKAEPVAAGVTVPPGDVVARLATIEEDEPYLTYLLRALQEDSPATDALFDQLVADAEDYLEQGVASGVLTPSADPAMRALVLTLMAFGPALLGRQVGRHVGTDGYGAEARRRLLLPMLEVFTEGLFAEPTILEGVRDAITTTGALVGPAPDAHDAPTPAQQGEDTP